MAIQEPKYIQNLTFVKNYGDKKLKVVTMYYCRNSGVEEDEKPQGKKRGEANSEKLDNNIIRARSKIFELAFCNDWAFFVTLTLDKEKYDRYDLKKFSRDFSNFSSQVLKSKYGCDFQYLLIPEKHKDGAWHLHGFVKGLSENLYSKFELSQNLPNAIRNKIKEGIAVYNFPLYSQKFGFCDMEEVRNPEAVSKYITKYVTKELSRSVTDLNANMYYCSKGLKRAELIKKGRFLDNIDYDFQNEYCSIKWVDYSDNAVSELSNSVVRCF